MTAKEYLKSICYLDNEINSKQAELDKLKHDAKNLNGITYNTDKVQVSSTNNSMQIIDKIVDLENTINEEIDRLIDLKADAHKKIAKVYNPRFITLLTDKYISGFTLEEIAEHMEVTQKTICRWHGQALQIFCRENSMK